MIPNVSTYRAPGRPTDVIRGTAAVTVIVACPDTVVYPACNAFAVTTTLPVALGVTTPVDVTDAFDVAVQATAVLNAPVP